MGLDPPAAPQPNAVQQINQPAKPLPPRAPERPVGPDAPIRPSPDSLRPVANDEAQEGQRRTSEVNKNRSGTLVTMIEIDLDANRVAMLSPEGTPLRGYVSTDLTYGLYTLRTDTKNEKWIFDSGQVKPGLRFHVGLIGVSKPFDLTYPEKLPLVVERGFNTTGTYTFADIKARISNAVSDHSADSYVQAFEILDLLSEVDLYDVIDELWIDEPGVVNDLLLHFEAVRKTKQFDMFRVLRALESFAWDRQKLYVDAFDACVVDPTSFSPDETRTKAGKSNIKLVFRYALMPERSIIVYADDIYESTAKTTEPPQYGEACLLYPRYCTAGTTPRMFEQKKQKTYDIEVQNFQFVLTAYQAVEHTLGLVMMASSLTTRTMSDVAAARRPPRPITEGFENQPGRWLRDFEAGLNTSDEAAAFQTRSCRAPRGWGYYRNGVQYDGYEERTLLEAKYYQDGGRAARLLTSRNIGFANRLLNQAGRQVRAAGEVPVEWRVSGETAANEIRALFRTNNVPIRVVYFPP